MKKTLVRHAAPYHRVCRGLVLACAGATVLAGCSARETGTSAARPAAGAPAVAPVVETANTKEAAKAQTAFAEVARVAEPAVVTITTRRRAQVVTPLPGVPSVPEAPGDSTPFGSPTPPSQDDQFEEFLRRFHNFETEPQSAPRDEPTPGRPTQEGGIGSGLIYRSDGLILTNAHVVQDAQTVTVKLDDKREFKNAKVLGRDERTDIAVVKIAAQNLPTVALGDSSQVKVGDWAIAVGTPFGLEKTLTVGVISAKAREVPLNIAGPGDYLQTDASINPGNSGGPLLDIQGRAIGVNSAIYTPTEGNVGIGFAIPINIAREIADILVKFGRVRRAQLGVKISNLENRGAALGLAPGTKGVLVESVEPGTPGAAAGLQPGDVVLAFNGKPVTRTLELQRMVSLAPIGSNASLKILRGNATLNITAKLAALKDESTPAPRLGRAPRPQASPTVLGLRLAALTPQTAQRYGISGGRGVVVTGLESNSPAAGAGIVDGDLIERVGQTAVSTPAAVQAAVNKLLARQSGPQKSVALYVNHKGERRFAIIDASP